jgi:hypothetical protein
MVNAPPRNIALTILEEFRALLLAVGAVAAALGALLKLRPNINEQLNTGIKDWHLVLAAACALLVLGVLHWIRRPASVLKEIRDLDPGRLYGREAEVESWLKHLSNHRLVWMSGESGCGKSSLVRFGLAPRLLRTGRFEPIYISDWGEDWAAGPWESLAACLSNGESGADTTVGAAVDALRYKAANGRTPVLLLDQFDDYQALHSDRFLPLGGVRLTAASLKGQNTFWAAIGSLLEEEVIRVLIVSRDDSPYGLECVRLLPPHDTHLARLEPGVAGRLLDEIVGANDVENP